jgi:hypothetical protein
MVTTMMMMTLRQEFADRYQARMPTHQPVDEDATHLAVDLRLLLHIARVVPRVNLLVLVVHVLVQNVPIHPEGEPVSWAPHLGACVFPPISLLRGRDLRGI